jgi:hypothetical protein
MRGFMVGGVLLLKSNKEYALNFNILAQVLVITIFKCANYFNQELYKQLVKAVIFTKFHHYGISWPVD